MCVLYSMFCFIGKDGEPGLPGNIGPQGAPGNRGERGFPGERYAYQSEYGFNRNTLLSVRSINVTFVHCEYIISIYGHKTNIIRSGATNRSHFISGVRLELLVHLVQGEKPAAKGWTALLVI